jgi:hypothetical protein
MAIFLDVEKILDAMFRQLPEGQFAEDRADSTDPTKRSLSSSDLRAQAQSLAAAYSNLESIFNNKFISSADADGISRWEKDLFSEAVDQSLPLPTRRANAIAKFNANGGISYDAITAILDPLFAEIGIAYEIVYWCGLFNGAWILDESALDVDTYLSLFDPLVGAGHGITDCSLDYIDGGLTAQDLEDIQRTAYTYEVRIFGTADADFIARLDKILTESEPARSTHYIYNSFPGPVAP